MLKAELRFSDLDRTPELQDGVIVIGESWIRPFRHPALETAVVRTEGQWFAVIRERLATRNGFELPTAEVDGYHYEQCYRACMRWPLDFPGHREPHHAAIWTALSARALPFRAAFCLG